MGKILVVGLCCIDVVNYVKKYPAEDSDTRVFHMETTLGGNGANSLTVLAQLDRQAGRLFAALPSGDAMLESLIRKHGIQVVAAPRPTSRTPVSTVIVNETTGTRTVLHYRGDVPEISSAEFQNHFPDLTEYSWIHFEGRNFEEIEKMVMHCKAVVDRTKCKISVELEKVRDFSWHDNIVPLVDLIFMSKDFAKSQGWHSGREAINGLVAQFGLTSTAVVVPWGELGVFALDPMESTILYEAAHPPAVVLDTLAAGDCFIGASLYWLNRHSALATVLAQASQVAGLKCGQRGLLGLCLDGLQL